MIDLDPNPIPDTEVAGVIHAEVVVITDRRFLVFPDEPTCVARMPKGNPCGRDLLDDEDLQYEDMAFTVPGIGMVDAYMVYASGAEGIRLQRCSRHVAWRGANLIEPEWCDFDPQKHAFLIDRYVCAWTPDGALLAPKMVSEWVQRGPTPGQMPAVSLTLPEDRTTLYRYFDADDVLLYIGIARSPHRRVGTHEVYSSWSDFAVRSTLQRFGTREDALAAEKAAIKAELPLFNRQHADLAVVTPLLVAYLVKHGRADLLAPAVSRG